ncbi:MAG: M24 family metallopeptidase [Alphaproteobacteria bacterium]
MNRKTFGVIILTMIGAFGLLKSIFSSSESMVYKVKNVNDLIRSRSQSEIVEDSKIGALKVSNTIQEIMDTMVVGQTTMATNERLKAKLREHNLLPSMLGSNGFPAETSISVSNELIHGIPSDKKISEGDLVTIQVSGSSEFSHASQGWTIPVGPISEQKTQLLNACKLGLQRAISKVKAGVSTGEISSAIQDVADAHNVFPVKDFTGYVMGKERIMRPNILSYWHDGWAYDEVLSAGTILNIHVMFKTGDKNIRLEKDGWTVRTTNGEIGAIATAMVLVQDDSGLELTKMIQT